MKPSKNIALVAHDNRKKDLVEWVEWNFAILLHHHLICTGTTGRKLTETLARRMAEEEVAAELKEITLVKSGPLGGDQQIGAMIAEGKVDLIIFFWDPMQPHPHDVDVKALLRIAVVYNIPIACNRATADFVISSRLLGEKYEPALKDYSEYLNRDIE